jgi:TRAP-type transport system small permease protein
LSFVNFVDRLNKLLFSLVGLALIVMVVSVFYQVIARFVLTSFDFNISVPWTEEIARYLMIWLVFVGGGLAARKGELIAVEALTEALPLKYAKYLKLLANICSIAFYLTLVIIGYQFATFNSSTVSPVMGIPMDFVYFSMVAGGAIMIFNTIAFSIENLKGKGQDQKSNTYQQI